MSTHADDADVQRLQAALAEALDERAKLWDELQRRAADERQLEDLRDKLTTMEGSVSWRVTAPIRVVKVVNQKLRRRTGPIKADLRKALRRDR